jgi:ABC-type antimicrobial peptide transport system permease subunit
MKFADYISLGFNNVWRRKSRSFLTILAVVIGAVSIIIMLSLVLGAKQIATQQLESIDGLTLISVSANPEVEPSGNLLNAYSDNSGSGKILNDTDVANLKKIQDVVDATPLSGVWVKSLKLEGQDKRFNANLMAYDPSSKVLRIPASIGRSLEPGDMDKVVIGIGLVRSLGYTGHPEDLIGKKLILFVDGSYRDWEPDPPKPPENTDKSYWEALQKQQREINATIIGVVTSGPDESQNYITLGWARSLMTTKDWEWDDEGRKLYDMKRDQLYQQLSREQEEQKRLIYDQVKTGQISEERAKELEENMRGELDATVSDRLAARGYNQSNFQKLVSRDILLKDGYSSILVRVDNTDNIEQVGKDIQAIGLGAQTAKEMLDEIEKIFRLVGMVIGAIGGIVLFVAALGIINNMIMATYERTREIGILRACGATRTTIMNMFIFEAAILGFLGGAIGLALSFGLAKILNIVGNQIALSQNVPIKDILSFPLWLVLGVISLTTIIGILAGLLPAIRAARMDPVDALKYE